MHATDRFVLGDLRCFESVFNYSDCLECVLCDFSKDITLSSDIFLCLEYLS